MSQYDTPEGMLSPYRVLDLTDEKGLFCSKLLGDLGADVIKIEKPGGDKARLNSPFYHDVPDPERGLFWLAYNVNKRGITLDIESAHGQGIFKKLVKTADIIVESFPPGYMDKLGLGYKDLEKLNPGVIMVSISPFGQTGPYRDYKGPDIITWALGGYMYVYGDADRSPVRVSHHSQSYLHASSAAAAGAMIALIHRQTTGLGQHVDTSIQECVAFCLEYIWANWDMAKVISLRGGVHPKPRLPFKWECKDGFIIWAFWGGSNADRLMKPLVNWIDKDGLATDYIKNFDWIAYNFNDAQQEVIDRIAEPTRKFFLRHTKLELYKGALERRLQLFPMGTVKDICEDIQLKSREYWVKLEHPELDEIITYPGPFIKATERPPVLRKRAPHIGEHNEEILAELKQKGKLKQDQAKKGLGATNARPLEGIRIVEFSSALAVPLIGKILGAFGAEVIKVESTTRLELMRAVYPFKDDIQGPDRAGRWLLDNTNKLSITIDIRKPAGRELAKNLVSKADIVTENFAAGVMDRLGLGYAELKKVKPDIIMLSSCMQGQTGPHSAYPGYGMQLTALAGMDAITGWTDREPQELGVFTDFLAPQISMITLLSALDYRRRTGKGQYFDLSQYEVAVQFLAPLVLDYKINGIEANREGNKVSNAAPHGAYRCFGNDRWCAIAVFTDEEWQSFCKTLGNVAWIKDPKFATLSARKANEDELNKLVETWTITRKAEEVMTIMQKAGVGAGLVATAQDVIDFDTHLKARQFIVELDHPEVKKYRGIRPHFILSKAPTPIKRAPLLGEHNEYVLKQVLGLSDEEVAQLFIERVIE